MIEMYTLNVSEHILNNFKDYVVRSYSDNFSIPIAFIIEDGKIRFRIYNADYAGIASCLERLKGGEEST